MLIIFSLAMIFIHAAYLQAFAPLYEWDILHLVGSSLIEVNLMYV